MSTANATGGQSRGTHHRKSHVNVVVTMPVDQTATAAICNRRLRGTSAGTKLANARARRQRAATVGRGTAGDGTYSTLVCSAATFLRGVAEMDERRSRKLDEERVRVAEESVRRASIIGSGLQRAAVTGHAECVRLVAAAGGETSERGLGGRGQGRAGSVQERGLEQDISEKVFAWPY